MEGAEGSAAPIAFETGKGRFTKVQPRAARSARASSRMNLSFMQAGGYRPSRRLSLTPRRPPSRPVSPPT